MKRAVFLDRDGVLNAAIVKKGKPFSPRSVSELQILPGVAEALELLKQRGFLLIVITNQPDVARGDLELSVADGINDTLKRLLPLDRIFACYHDDADNCDCRKPKAGAIITTAKELGISIDSSYMIGDRWKDIAAGNTAGCTTIFLDRGYKEKRPEAPDYMASCLSEATEFILGEPR